MDKRTQTAADSNNSDLHKNSLNCKKLLLTSAAGTASATTTSTTSTTTTAAKITPAKTTTIKAAATKVAATPAKKQRNKLIRATESIGHNDAIYGENTNQKQSTKATASDVMGGGFAAPPSKQMHEKLQQQIQQQITKIGNTESSSSGSAKKERRASKDIAKVEQKEAKDKLKLTTATLKDKEIEANSKEKEKAKELEKSKKEKQQKPHKESKFAAKLRRSFRRNNEQKSFEINRPDKVDTTALLQDTNSLQETRNTATKTLQREASGERSSIFSLSNLPGLGGHINPALLLDSPEEATPPEFNYRHLSSVATTNSSTSVESSDLGNDYCSNSTQSSTTNTAPQQTNNSMGGEVSTNSSVARTQTTAASATGGSVTRQRPKLQKQSSSKSDGGFVSLTPTTTTATATTTSSIHTTASRSCSLTSESSSARLTRLQNFLFKSSGESSRSYLGHSNDGFTASSHNSSSGEWENLAASGSYSESLAPSCAATAVATSSTGGHDSNAGSYYQYTLTSPNNPFLPEIIARTYRSTYDEEEEDAQHAIEMEELDANVTSVKYVGQLYGSGSVQQITPASSSRTNSQEGQDGSAASSPGRQKRKLFQLNSPQTHYQQLQQLTSATCTTTTAPTTTQCTSRCLNPFLCSTKSAPPATQGSASYAVQDVASSPQSGSAFGKRLPLKQVSAVTSPIAVPPDLNAKREEFLRATMKICLVVSPPSSKLQLKSKSLTHLDGLDSLVACHQGPATKPICPTPALTQSYTTPHPFPNAFYAPTQHQQSHQPSQKRATSPQSTRTLAMPLRNNMRSTQLHAKSPPQGLSPTATTNSISNSINTCCNNKIYCLPEAAGDCDIVGGIGGNHYQSSLSSSSPYITTSPHSAVYPALSLQSNIESPSATSAATSTVHQTLSPLGGGNVGGLPSTSTSSGVNAVNFFHWGISGGATPSSTHRKKSSYMQRKKPLLTRSEVSSSEYFSVSFCTENGYQEDEFIPATKGVTLATALSQALRRRNLSFSQITVTDNNVPAYLEAGNVSNASSLDENTEVENLAGRHLIITDRDGSRKTLQKAASFGSRTRPPRLLSSASTEETTESADQRIVPGKQLKQRWSGLFGIKNPQQSQLCELLNSYAKLGVPQKTAALNFDHPDFDAAQEYLDNMHKSWRDFVHCEEMSDSETRIQTAIWELVTTEVYYIHALQTVTDLFLACLEAVQEEKLLTDVDQHRLFSNVRDICEANLKFWTLHLYPMVAHSVATREPLRIEFFQPGFNTFATTFAPYKKYCAEQSTCQFYCKELNRTNALYTSYLAWCESQKMCNRLRLADILVRPMQRLTKYSLLLTAIKKHMVNSEEIEAIDSMIHTVENFVCSVNNHLTTRQENERLKGVMARIESYDVVDTNNELLDKMVKQYSQMFDLCAPMKGCASHQVRHLFMEGDHKFKDHLGKADVHCFLLTDMLLVCKTIAKKGLGTLKIIRQPYLTDRLVVHHNTNSNILNCVYLNEFQVAVTAFTLQCSEAKNWYESLKRTKMIYTRLKQGGNNWDGCRFGTSAVPGSGTAGDSLGVKKSPLNSSICSHVTSANNSHSGSVEWNDSRNISVDFEKTNSLSSDEGSSLMGTSHAYPLKIKALATSPHKLNVIASSANTLSVQPLNLLGQSLPNLNLHHNQTNLYHTYSNNTLLVPGTTSSHSGNMLLSPCHRGISYPPPSPTRVPLRRGMAFSASIKNPPLVKTRNITSQNSINWHQIPATPTPTSPQTSQHNSPCHSLAKISNNSSVSGASGASADGADENSSTTAPATMTLNNDTPTATTMQPSSSSSTGGSNVQLLQNNNETDV